MKVPRIFFASDHHFGHEKIATRYRGFDSAASMNRELIARHNDVVGPDDITYFLGDLSAGGSASTFRALSLVFRLNGRKRLIAGNHDPIHPMNRDAWKWQATYLDYFEGVAPFARIALPDGKRVLLSHFPYHTDRGAPRYTQYRLKDEGMRLLHGHTHSNLAATSQREIHVGVDAWHMAPVSGEMVASMFDAMDTVADFPELDSLSLKAA